jgi:hypothetical protein
VNSCRFHGIGRSDDQAGYIIIPISFTINKILAGTRIIPKFVIKFTLKKYLIMKKLILVILGSALVGLGFSQSRPVVSESLRNIAVGKNNQVPSVEGFIKTPVLPANKSTISIEEETIGSTRYDLQTNTSIQNRIHVFGDGTIGATWTMGFEDPGFADRGTGYNYYDGNNWGPEPTARIESIRTGWPSYTAFGENGELVVSHDFAPGRLMLLTRNQKGTGIWNESFLNGPGVPISWPRAITSGNNHSVIQLLAITWPVANGGPIYQGLNGALLYSRSTDGGLTWNPENTILPGLTSGEYAGFSADDYEWAVQGDNIAFLLGDSWFDFILMKSIDGGNNWNKTIIWEHPYPFFNTGNPIATDTFYCVDGAHHLAFDSQGKVHVVFGINRSYSDGANSYWFPYVDGVGYWNEDMPTFSSHKHALNPYGHPDSELTDDHNLIGWTQDVDGDGEITLVGDIGTYYIGLSSQPQIVIDNMDFKYVVWSSVTETYDNGLQNYRHLWGRGSWGEDVWGPFVHLTADLIHIFDECVFPSAATFTDDSFYLVYQTDEEPGLAVRGDMDPYGDNFTQFMKVSKNQMIPVGIEENHSPVLTEDVSQNYPNPFSGTSYVHVNIRRQCRLSLTVTNLMGQVVYEIPAMQVDAGSMRLAIHGQHLKSGLYFYTVKAGEGSVTKKMIVE